MYPQTSPLPFGRDATRMAFDAARGQLVLFGGTLLPGGLMNDTWTYDGTTWMQRNPATAPTARSQHAMCYDSVRQKVVLFGGQSAGMPWGETWEWDGTNWTLRSFPAGGPVARYRTGLAFDGTRSVLFGGQSGATLGDTWVLDAAGWTQLTPAASPSARSSHQMASNGAGEVLLFGGPNLNDTWLFNGTTWTQQSPATPPPVRNQPYLARDPVAGRYLLFGGTNAFFQPQEDTWAFAGGQWTQLTTLRAPSTRSGGAAAWFAPQQRFVIYGGATQQTAAADLRSGIHGWEFGTALGSFMPWGPSVCPPLDPPVLRGAGQPAVGRTFRATIESFSSVHGFVTMGFSTTTWSGGALPFSLTPFTGWPNCFLHVSPDVTLYLGFGTSTPWTLTIPPSPAYVGTTFHAQGFTYGSGGSPNNLSIANAGTGIIDLN